ncbi:Na+/H+ antiporter subunit A [Mobilicoccus caccae]|uniref:Na+/H+ antiporter subunit A n=1 Tax=Mobilicoccus caccae TaxID=1859295 RepID=A0ABQ6IRH3_9MICO|nr:Na+/H+ antiporter subunit A [Mobilicoccus caccae]GMA39273.1 Na+/H+ antiporter subunit A [Mobilicoccus caccae]
MIALIAAHLVVALFAPTLIGRLGTRAFWILALPPAATALWALAMYPAVSGGPPPVEVFPWVPSLGLELAFRMDALAWLMTLVVSVIGVLVLVYCAGYFAEDEPGLGRFGACLLAFAGAMLGLVTSDDVLMLFIFWEFTTVLSYLLIGHRPESRASRWAAMEALVVTTFGGLAMLVGLIMLGEQAGSYRLSDILAAPQPGAYTVWAVILLLVGALSKSALVPFHFWLPGAMAAPTPVSAYLHAAAMVKAGIYLVARLAPAYSDLPGWQPIVLVLGGLTMLVGALAALRQTDIKLLLAYGTVSQLGFLTVLNGAGTPKAALAGLAVLLAHALFKSSLFLVVGAVDHATGTRDLRRLTGLGRRMPLLCAAAVISAASMAGLPPMLGFVGKEVAYGAFTSDLTDPVDLAVLAVLVGGSVLTLMYSLRFIHGTFSTKPGVSELDLHELPRTVVYVPAILAAATVVAGPLSQSLEAPLLAHAALMGQLPESAHLGLWHGINAALLLSVLTWVLGFGLDAIARRRDTAAHDARVQRTGLGQASYRYVMRSLDRVSLEVTGAIQRGSLPLSLGLILVVYLVLGGGALLLGRFDWAGAPMVWADGPAQAITAVAVAFAAFASVRSRRRLRAVLLVGVTGYGCAFLFLLHGAPDLALTQVLVETISIIVFVLVLRRLPGRFDDDPSRRTLVLRGLLGVSIGIVTAALAFIIPTWRTATPASVGMAERAYDFGAGKNIVNVILVDMRAWDTMGELSVVLAAATGIASLVFLRETNVEGARRKLGEILARRSRVTVSGVGDRWLAEGMTLLQERRSVILEIVTRLVFHVVIVWSVYLLLAGHNSPGGGFAAGLVAGLGICLRYLAGGRDEVRATLPIMPAVPLGIGLFLSAGNGLASMLVGGDVLQTWDTYLQVPFVGEVHLVSSLVFDIGVYLVVVGLVLDILQSLGGALDAQIEASPGRTRDDSPAQSDDHRGAPPRHGEDVAKEHLRVMSIHDDRYREHRPDDEDDPHELDERRTT